MHDAVERRSGFRDLVTQAVDLGLPLEVANEQWLVGADQFARGRTALVRADGPKDVGSRLAQQRPDVPGDAFAVRQADYEDVFARKLEIVHLGARARANSVGTQGRLKHNLNAGARFWDTDARI